MADIVSGIGLSIVGFDMMARSISPRYNGLQSHTQTARFTLEPSMCDLAGQAGIWTNTIGGFERVEAIKITTNETIRPTLKTAGVQFLDESVGALAFGWSSRRAEINQRTAFVFAEQGQI